MLLANVLHHVHYLGLRLLYCDVRLKASNRQQPIGAPVGIPMRPDVHGDINKVRLTQRKTKTCRHHPNDHVGPAI